MWEILLTSVFLLAGADEHLPAYEIYNIHVTSVYDGDTLTADVDLGLHVTIRDQKVRLCGINAPELRPLVTRVAAKKSRDRLIEIINTSTSTQLVVPQDKFRDSFGRLLGYVIVEGENVNMILLREGLAKPYRHCKPSGATW